MGPSLLVLLCTLSTQLPYSYGAPKSILNNGDIESILSPLKHNSNGNHTGTKYYNSTPHEWPSVPIIRHDSRDPSCNIQFKLKWNTHVGSSILSTPIIYPNTASTSNNKKQVFLSTYSQYIEMINDDGSKPFGWPLQFEDSSFLSTPILYDIDGDGTIDMGIVDKNANMFWIQIGEFGKVNENFHIQVPQLKIKKEWYKGLDAKYQDEQVKMSMFDRQRASVKTHEKKQFSKADALEEVDGGAQITYPEQKHRILTELPERKVDEVDSKDASEGVSKHEKKEGKEEQGKEEEEEGKEEEEEGKENEEGLAGDIEEGTDDLGDVYYGKHVRKRGRLLDDDYDMSYAAVPNEMSVEGFVFVDPHVLGNPTLADVNGDGKVEVIMAVSYYFDKTRFPENFTDYEPDMYIAGGVVCWDVESQDWAWMVHLDLTTDMSHFKALIFGSPTVVDLDGDGRSEVIIGTSLGLLYVLDGDTGFTKRFFPMQFHEIQAQVAVADIMGGPDLEIIVCDMGGNVVVVDSLGEILWDTKLSGQLPHTPSIGDVDGDGSMDICVVAVAADGSSHIWVLEGSTGLPLNGYPVSLPRKAAISSSVILVDLHDYSAKTGSTVLAYEDPALPPWARNSRKNSPIAASPAGSSKTLKTAATSTVASQGLHLLVPSHDGHLYVIDGVKGCAERIDVGEHIYSVPLVDDVSGDGYLDIILGTVNGEVMLLETSIPYHPLNAWASFPKSRMNGFTHGQQGISIPEVQKRVLKFAEVKGSSLIPVTFDIWDSRKESIDTSPVRAYRVSISKGLNKLSPLIHQTYSHPGRYTLLVPVSPPESMVLVVSMTNEYGQYFEDLVPVAVSTRFYIWIKYLVIAPVLAMSIPLLLASSQSKHRI